MKLLKSEVRETIDQTGISYNWSLAYHTISKETVMFSQMLFIDLYNNGYAY